MNKNVDFALEMVRYLVSLGVISEINEDLATSAIHSQLDSQFKTLEGDDIMLERYIRATNIAIQTRKDLELVTAALGKTDALVLKMESAINRVLNTAEKIDASYRISSDTINLLKEAVS